MILLKSEKNSDKQKDTKMTDPASSNIRKSTIQYNGYDVFLDTDIGSPEEYRDLIMILFSANEGDVITFNINSNGGHLDSAMAIIEGIKHSKARIEARILGACHSAASMILMYCPDVIVFKSSYCMIHTATFGSFGMTPQIKSHTDFNISHIEDILDDAYDGFLTAEELDKVKNGVEMWFGSEEIARRLANRQNKLQSQEAVSEEPKEEEVPVVKKPRNRKKKA